ncbi:MAG TPA: MFS transporter [Candidatus Angelobacter sp.]|nr:MFS transporter [Candidatus Angelobacter sp.]
MTATPDTNRLGRGAFLALMSSALTIAVFQTMVVPLLPGLRDQLHVSTAAVSWVLTANFMAAAVCAPLLGRLGDMFGKRRALAAAMVLLCAGSLVAATTTSFPLLLVARVLQGSASAVFPLSMTIVADEWDERRLRAGIGWLSATLALGASLGLVLAGAVSQFVHDYHVIFWGGTVCALASGIAVVLSVPSSRNVMRGRIDVAGALLMAAWLTVLLLGIAQLGKRGVGDAQALGLTVGGAALFLLWIAVERRVRQPLVDPRQLFMPAVLSANLMALLIGFGIYGPLFLITEFVQTPATTGYGLGLSVLATGLVMLPQGGGSLVASRLAGIATYPARLMVRAGAVTLAIGLLELALLHSALWEVLLGNTLLGLGGSLAFATLPAIIIDAVPPSDTGVATGINTIMRTVGGAVAGAVLGGILTGGPGAAGGFPTQGAYIAAFLMCAVVVAAAVPLTAVRVRRRAEPAAAVATLSARR